MRTLRLSLLVLILLFPVLALRALQDNPALRFEITAVDSSQMPTVTVNANVYDALGQPVLGLTEENFSLTGDLAESATITNVQNITDDALPFATVLMIDISSSMAGAPIENARRAAQAFVDAVGPNDPVAIMTFGSNVRLRQDYTTDKAALTAVINSLIDGGETALYQGAYDAIQTAANSPTPRRAVILLSDGAEYGGESDVARAAAAAEALALGVPVYTIGLGYGIDRTYLQELSASTSSQFYESPLAEELTEIYTALAAKLRSQYIITLDVPLPLDGTQYTLGLNVTTPEGSADATAVLRAPIPVPILRLPDLSAPLTEQTEIRAELLADDAVETVIFQINDEEPIETEAASPAIIIDPVGFLPGTYLLTVSATDEDDDTGSTVTQFTVAALPSQVTLSPDPSTLSEIITPQTIMVDVTGQTVPTDITYAFEDDAPTDISETSTFTIDPINFVPGEHSVTVTVTNEGVITTEQPATFNVGAVLPVITIDGLENGQTIDAPITFTVDVQAQSAVSPVVTVNGTVLEPDADGAYSIDPMNYAPGNYTLNVTASDTLVSVTTVNFTVAALPPEITVDGLEAGETLYGNRQITPEFTSQSEIISLAVSVDDAELAQLDTPPFSFTLRVLDFAPGEHTLRLTAENADGQSGTLEIPFSIAAEPAATATAIAVSATIASETQQAVITQRAAATQIAVQATQVAVITATQQAVASATQAAQAVIIAQETQSAQSTQSVRATATQVALDTQATQVSVEATGTAASLATSAAEQVAQDQAATANASATQAAEEQREAATATQAAEATSAALDQAASATNAAQATATQAAEATNAAQQAALDQAATATNAAQATERANQLATQDAQRTATAQTQATEEAEASQTAQAQSLAQASATQAAQTRLDNRATAQAQAQAALQVATRDALATSNAESRQAAQATQDARATRNAIATATQQIIATAAALQATQTQDALATRDADATATQDARATATSAAEATAAILQATQNSIDATATNAAQEEATTRAAQETLAALEATATGLIVEATATRNALETQTANNATATQSILNETATEAAALEQATQAAADERATQNAATADRAAQVTATAQEIALAAQATSDQATRNAGATATSIAQATLDTRMTAVGPTSTQAESGAQDTPLTPSPQPTLTEVQTGEAAAASNLAPIAIIVIVVIIIIVVLVLIMRGRGSPGMRR